jgi:DNA-binding transcriptional regulator YiaG
MPNIASIFKDEIVRLARKEVRKEVEGLKKTSAQYRSDIAGLKRRVAALEKQQARVEQKGPKKAIGVAEDEVNSRYRFSAKRFAAQRQKLGVSAGDMGALIGVSAQTIYNWEAGKSRPRQQQLAAIAAVRKLGKRQVQARLADPAE